MSLIRADARQIPLVDGCVQCCVTSPPYWGLRDYGTATWLGGDLGCDHIDRCGPVNAPSLKSTLTTNNGRGPLPGDKYQADRTAQYRSVCGKCGAQRIDSQIGLEPTPDAYVQSLVGVFREVWRVLKDDGTCWLNLGDSYAAAAASDGANIRGGLSKAAEKADGRPRNPAGRRDAARAGIFPDRRGHPTKPKDLVGIPWRVAFALQTDGWYLRSDIIWSKPNPMPESVTDRPTKAHEYIFLLTKAERYYYDATAIKEPHATGDRPDKWECRVYDGKGPAVDDGRRNGNVRDYRLDPDGRNKRSVWYVATQPYSGAHFATWPEKLIEPCILAGSRLGDLVFDPFCGSGTTLAVAERFGRRAVGTDLGYQDLAKQRTQQRGLRWQDEGTA